MLKEKQLQKETQLEMQFYVHQDLENVLGILAETAISYQLLKNHNDQSYLPIAQNRLILQTNLSNAIHYDQYLNYENNETLKKQLKEEKKKAHDNFIKIVYEEKLIDVSDHELQKICEHYLSENLNDKNNLKQLNPVIVKTKASFNAETVQKVIGGIQSVDQQIQEIKQGNYKPPTIEKLKEKIIARQEHCKKQLRKNFKIKVEDEKDELYTKQNEQSNPQPAEQNPHKETPLKGITLTKPIQIQNEDDESYIPFSDDEEFKNKNNLSSKRQHEQEIKVKDQKLQTNEDLLGIENDSQQFPQKIIKEESFKESQFDYKKDENRLGQQNHKKQKSGIQQDNIQKRQNEYNQYPDFL